jgi:hypothetical protein
MLRDLLTAEGFRTGKRHVVTLRVAPADEPLDLVA